MSKILAIDPVATFARSGYTVTDVVDNILSTFDRADTDTITSGVDWYPSAHEVASNLARRYGLTTVTVAGIIAALSPRTPWARNVEGAERCARGVLDGGFLSRSVDAANAIRNGARTEDVLGGRKTLAFARNIALDYSAVTVDVWALRVALPGEPVGILSRAGMYDAVSDAYRYAALERGIEAPAMQATTWIVERGSAH